MSRSNQAVIAALLLVILFLLYSSPFCDQHNDGDSRAKPHHPVSKFKVVHSVDDLELYIYSAILDDRYGNIQKLFITLQ